MEWSDAAVQMLLDLLLEFRDWFTDRETDRDDNTIWEVRRMVWFTFTLFGVWFGGDVFCR